MKKGIILIIAIAVLGIGGYFIGYPMVKQYVSDQVMDRVIDEVAQDKEVDKLLADPEVKRLAEKSLTSEDVQKLSGEVVEKSGNKTKAEAPVSGSKSGSNNVSNSTANSSTGSSSKKKLVVNNRQEAADLIAKKLSAGEIRTAVEMASGGLTEAEKSELKQKFMSRFTSEEMESLKIVALIELQKRKNSTNQP